MMLRQERARALRNLEIAFPDMAPSLRHAMTRAMFKTLGRNAYEFLTLEGSSRERVLGLIERVEGEEYLERSFGLGKGLIVITGHIGCFELLAAYWAKRGYVVTVVGRELWEKRLNRQLVSIRESLGYRTIDRDSGAKSVLRVLQDKNVVALLIDQHTRVSGIYVPFFNRPAHTPIGVAKMALATGAPILPMAIYMTRPGRHTIRILPPIKRTEGKGDRSQEVEEITRRCSEAIEDLIRFDPKQWAWFHERWREPEEAEARYASVG